MSGSLHLDTRRHGFIPKSLLLPNPKHPPSVVFLSFAPGLLMFIMRIITMKCTIWLSWLDLLASTTSWVTRALREPRYHEIIIKGWTFHDIQLWLLFPFSIWKIRSLSLCAFIPTRWTCVHTFSWDPGFQSFPLILKTFKNILSGTLISCRPTK